MNRTKIVTFSAAALAIATLGGCVITDNSQVVSSVVSAPGDISPFASTAANLKEQPSGNYEVEPSHTKVFWRVTHMGLSNYTASLTKVSGTLNFDSDNVTNSKVDITIDPNVVDTGIPSFDKEISDKFFDSGKYPTIKFVSTSLVKTGDVTGALTGNLTFHGVTKPVTLQVKFNGGKLHPMRGVHAMGFSAVGSFKRSDFGADKYVPIVGDEVSLIIETEFLKK